MDNLSLFRLSSQNLVLKQTIQETDVMKTLMSGDPSGPVGRSGHWYESSIVHPHLMGEMRWPVETVQNAQYLHFTKIRGLS